MKNTNAVQREGTKQEIEEESSCKSKGELINRHMRSRREQRTHSIARKGEREIARGRWGKRRRNADMRLTWRFLIRDARCARARAYVCLPSFQRAAHIARRRRAARGREGERAHICKRIRYTIVNLGEIAPNEFVNSFISCSFASITPTFFSALAEHKACFCGAMHKSGFDV